MPNNGSRSPVTGSWLARVTTARVPVFLSLTSQAHPLPWMPASAVLVFFLRVANEPKSRSIDFFSQK